MPKERLRLFLALLLITSVLMIVQNRWGPVRPLRFLSYPLNFAAENYISVTTSIRESRASKSYLEDKLRLKDKELAQLRIKQQRTEELLSENIRLRKLLKIKRTEGTFVAAASVISRGSERWANTYVLNKGSSDGIEKNMVAITPRGLLGKVHSVTPDNSIVLLIDDRRFSVAVRLQSNRAEAVFSGTGVNSARLKYLGIDTKVEAGSVIVTSGMDGIFPSGTRVGFVSSVTTEPEALFHEIAATPFVDTTNIEEVIIIKR